MNIEIRPNDNPGEREDRYGRVRVSHRRTWLVVVDGEGDSEHRTKRDALARAERLRAGAALTAARAALHEARMYIDTYCEGTPQATAVLDTIAKALAKRA